MSFKKGGRYDGFFLVNNLIKSQAITAPSILQFAAANYGLDDCLGTRLLLEKRQGFGGNKCIEKFNLGKYIYQSYQEVNELVIKFGIGLNYYFNFNNNNNDNRVNQQQSIAIYSETQKEWLIAALGCLRQRVIVVSLPTNLPPKTIINSLLETEIRIIITSCGPLLAKLQKEILPTCPQIDYVIILDDHINKIGPTVSPYKTSDNFNIISYYSLIFAGQENEDICKDNIKYIDESDVAFIMYTCGTIDEPKGVKLTHGNIFSAVSAFCIRADYRQLGNLYLAYLPLAYVTELIIELSCIAMNITIAYSSPSTLTNKSPQILEGCHGDFIEAQPTCVLFVSSMLKYIMNGITKNNYSIWDHIAFEKKNKLKWITHVWDKYILRKICEQFFGNRLMTVIIGGDLISKESYQKLRTLFNCSVIIGYGTTETTACITSSNKSDDVLHCGDPNYRVKLSLIDWIEGDFKTTDKPHPRGEVVVSGPMVAREYSRITGKGDDGGDFFLSKRGIWSFKTGDIGEINCESGMLRIIDRKINFQRLKNGEYVSLGEIESLLKTHPLIDNVCVYVYPNSNIILALVVPSPPMIIKMSTHLNIHSSDVRVLCRHSCIIKTILNEIRAYGRKYGICHLPSAVYLCQFPWTPESGLVSLTYKIRRHVIFKYYEEKLKAMYVALLK